VELFSGSSWELSFKGIGIVRRKVGFQGLSFGEFFLGEVFLSELFSVSCFSFSCPDGNFSFRRVVCGELSLGDVFSGGALR